MNKIIEVLKISIYQMYKKDYKKQSIIKLLALWETE